MKKFQSTSPTGEDTDIVTVSMPEEDISIHFPHRGRHVEIEGVQTEDEDFNPLPPQGKTRFCGCVLLLEEYFNPLPPQGKTQDCFLKRSELLIFQSTSPTGEDTPLHRKPVEPEK